MSEQKVPTHDGGQLALYSYGTEDAVGERRVVVVGGAFLTALIYRPFSMALAKGLGEGWAVDVYDRRGRGNSTPQPDDYSMATEIADVRTVLDVTGARNVFGHSLGGSVALNAVQEFAGGPHEPARLAVYDAAVNIDGSIDTEWLDGFEAAVNAGQIGHALARMKQGMQPGTALARVPEPILAGLMALMSRTKVNKAFTELMPSAVGELRAAYDETDSLRDFSVLPATTHFMVGGKSPEYYRETAKRLHAAVNIDGSIDTEWLDGFEAAVNAGQIGHALARMKQGMQPGTALARVPEPILAGLMALMSRTKVNRAFTELMPSAVGELKAAYDETDSLRDFSVLPATTHFMVGGKSPEYYRETAKRLHAAVHGSTLRTTPKGVHGSIPAAFKELVTDIADYYRG